MLTAPFLVKVNGPCVKIWVIKWQGYPTIVSWARSILNTACMQSVHWLMIPTPLQVAPKDMLKTTYEVKTYWLYVSICYDQRWSTVWISPSWNFIYIRELNGIPNNSYYCITTAYNRVGGSIFELVRQSILEVMFSWSWRHHCGSIALHDRRN